MRTLWKILCLLTAVVILAPSISGQQAAKAGTEDATLSITPEQRAQVVKTILKEFEERYVFPDVAAQVKETLTGHLEGGSYSKIGTGQELARVLTVDLQNITKDKHVRVICSNEKLPVRAANLGPSAADRERMREDLRIRNAGFTKVERLPGNIGYLRLDGFMNPEQGKDPLHAAMLFLKNTDALIIDLRYNGGGTPLMIRDLCSYFFDEKPVHLNSMFFRKDNRTEEFWTHKDVPGPKYLNKDVYLLTSAYTFSGAEECAYNFQTQKRGTIVGERTGGGAHPGGMVTIAEHYQIFIPTGRAINPITKTNWEGVGVKPDFAASSEKALDVAHELAVKKLVESTDKKVSQRVKQDLELQERMKARIEQRRQENLKSQEQKTSKI